MTSPQQARGAWRAAMLKYLTEELYDGSGKTRLEALAEAFVDEAYEKRDIAFFKELADRIDGKTSQPIEVTPATDQITALISSAIERAAQAFAVARRPMIEIAPSQITSPESQLALTDVIQEMED